MSTLTQTQPEVVQINGPLNDRYDTILSSDALEFLTGLHRLFNRHRLYLLQQREDRKEGLDKGEMPRFLDHTWAMRECVWRVNPVPEALQDRRVEITGPTDRKMIINALNSGAKVFMADFEDSNAPTWENIIEGQINLYDAVRRQIDFDLNGKRYELNEKTAVLKVRPRGWHLQEKHILIDGEPASASLVDFGLFFFHNAQRLVFEGRGPFFYLPKMESYLEARLWNDVFLYAQDQLNIPRGTIKATVLIETILAAFEMEEILYELREHSAGLNAGRWDYIFSIIKKFSNHRDFMLPDRGLVTMNVPFMKAYAELLVKTCHKRGAHAMGGMSAFIPSKDEAVNAQAFEQVRADKEREVKQGYDGTWVAHPKLVEVAMEIFGNKLQDQPHQKHVLHENLKVTPEDLLNIKSLKCTITEAGFRKNVNVALLYIESWLKGVGAAALYNLMEDAATAEISRAQLWQWLHHKDVLLEDGTPVTIELYRKIAQEEYESIRDTHSDLEFLQQSYEILNKLVLNEKFEDFLTLKAYEYLN